jgi:hypothetical protein
MGAAGLENPRRQSMSTGGDVNDALYVGMQLRRPDSRIDIFIWLKEHRNEFANRWVI